MMFAKRLLQRMQAPVAADQPLDRDDIGALRLYCEHRAGLHRFPVHVDCASPAMTGIAADMRAGDPELLAQQVDQQYARLGQGFDLFLVDPQL
jgi:hypothetical protein